MNENVKAVDTVPNRLITDIAIENLKLVDDVSNKLDIVARNLFGIEPSDKSTERAISGLRENEEVINERLNSINNRFDYILNNL